MRQACSRPFVASASLNGSGKGRECTGVAELGDEEEVVSVAVVRGRELVGGEGLVRVGRAHELGDGVGKVLLEALVGNRRVMQGVELVESSSRPQRAVSRRP